MLLQRRQKIRPHLGGDPPPVMSEVLIHVIGNRVEQFKILWNHNGEAILHSRRSYSLTSSHTLADLHSLYWAVESMVSLKKLKIIFEFSSLGLRDALAHPNSHPEFRWLFEGIHIRLQRLDSWCLRLAPSSENKAVMEIAMSVIRDSSLHSYVARNGPSWLHSLLSKEAAA